MTFTSTFYTEIVKASSVQDAFNIAKRTISMHCVNSDTLFELLPGGDHTVGCSRCHSH